MSLRYLKKLSLNFNSISEIGELPRNLEILSVNNNKLTSLGDKLLQLKYLNTLELSYNRLKEIDGLEKMRYLRVLFVKYNQVGIRIIID